MKLPHDLPPESVVAVTDTREQLPLDLSPLQIIRGTLATGDYSVHGLENLIALERKSLPDLISCVGVERERFDREVQRLLAYPVRALVVESTWQEIERGQWRSAVTANAAMGSLLGWIATGLPIVMAGDHGRAGMIVSKLLYLAARREYRKAPVKTGIERREPSDTERELIKQVNEAKKKGGYTSRDPAAELKSYVDTQTTRLNNEIKEWQRRLDTGDYSKASKTPSPKATRN